MQFGCSFVTRRRYSSGIISPAFLRTTVLVCAGFILLSRECVSLSCTAITKLTTEVDYLSSRGWYHHGVAVEMGEWLQFVELSAEPLLDHDLQKVGLGIQILIPKHACQRSVLLVSLFARDIFHPHA